MKHWYTDGVDEIQLQENSEIPVGFHPGRKPQKSHIVSEETKQKLSESRKGKPAWNAGKHESEKHVYYTDGKISIRIKETDEPPAGFWRGRLTSKLTVEKAKEADAKRKNTCLERYGDSTFNNVEKRNATCIEKYGVSNPLQDSTIKQKVVDTNLERYGVSNVFKAEEIKSKIHFAIVKKYGVDNISQADSNKDKIKKSWVTKSQEELQDIVNRRRTTSLERYGVDSPAKSQEVKDRISKTCMERYGVPFYTLTSRLSMSNDSKPNREFADKLSASNISYSREFVVGRKRFDFKVDNNLVEIDPTETHNSTWGIFGEDGINPEYHLLKTKLATEHGYRCIHVWDWDDPDKIISLLKPRIKLFARKCEVKELTSSEAKQFIDNYHLQNYVKSDINLGLIYEGQVVSVMTFGKPRYNKKFEYELLRYCSSYNVVGGAQKLFKYFINNFQPRSIVSYCDYSKFTGGVYKDLGFNFESMSIGRHWYNLKTKIHITDNLLRQRGFDQLFGTSFGKGTSNDELMKEYGFLEVYDAGQGRYCWYK